jgi:hypothetical protein
MKVAIYKILWLVNSGVHLMQSHIAVTALQYERCQIYLNGELHNIAIINMGIYTPTHFPLPEPESGKSHL